MLPSCPREKGLNGLVQQARQGILLGVGGRSKSMEHTKAGTDAGQVQVESSQELPLQTGWERRRKNTFSFLVPVFLSSLHAFT